MYYYCYYYYYTQKIVTKFEFNFMFLVVFVLYVLSNILINRNMAWDYCYALVILHILQSP